MIIGISGAQGQGKSTLIKAAVECNSTFNAPTIQTSRNILNTWGFTLNEVNRYMPLKIKFQEQLLDEHCRALNNLNSGVHLVERTFADIFAYAILGLGSFNEYSDWLDEYYIKCRDAQLRFFDHVVYLFGRDYTPEDDGVRSTNKHFSSIVTNLIERYIIEFFPLEYENGYSFIDSKRVDDRVDELNRIVHNIGRSKWDRA